MPDIDRTGTPILELRDLSVEFPVKGAVSFRKKKTVQAVTGVSLSLWPGETFGIVGESGCGKSTLGNAMIGMVRPTAGTVLFEGEDLWSIGKRAFRERRRKMQMIFQDPFSSLNPRFDVFQIVSEPMFIRGGATEAEMETRVLELLKLVGLSEKDLHRHPSDFSGGQRQRIGIARAIILNPRFLVCDEPVSALDVSVHAQILNLLVDLQRQLGMTYVFISHNLAVVKNVCDRLVVMYLGKVMESGDSEAVFADPRHPYTEALLSAVLDVDVDHPRERIRLHGEIPSPIDPPKGCRFWPRCPKAMEGCKTLPPPETEVSAGHFVRCHLQSGFSAEQKAAGLDAPASPEPDHA